MSTKILTICLLLMHGLVLQPLCHPFTHLARKTLLLCASDVPKQNSPSPSLGYDASKGGGRRLLISWYCSSLVMFY